MTGAREDLGAIAVGPSAFVAGLRAIVGNRAGNHERLGLPADPETRARRRAIRAAMLDRRTGLPFIQLAIDNQAGRCGREFDLRNRRYSADIVRNRCGAVMTEAACFRRGSGRHRQPADNQLRGRRRCRRHEWPWGGQARQFACQFVETALAGPVARRWRGRGGGEGDGQSGAAATLERKRWTLA